MGAHLRIGVNALYLIPGGVGGTEIYLRSLLAALGEIDPDNQYFVFTNRETGAGLVPDAPNFHWQPQSVRAASRPARILWEQTCCRWPRSASGSTCSSTPGSPLPGCAAARR